MSKEVEVRNGERVDVVDETYVSDDPYKVAYNRKVYGYARLGTGRIGPKRNEDPDVEARIVANELKTLRLRKW